MNGAPGGRSKTATASVRAPGAALDHRDREVADAVAADEHARVGDRARDRGRETVTSPPNARRRSPS